MRKLRKQKLLRNLQKAQEWIKMRNPNAVFGPGPAEGAEPAPVPAIPAKIIAGSIDAGVNTEAVKQFAAVTVSAFKTTHTSAKASAAQTMVNDILNLHSDKLDDADDLIYEDVQY